MTHSILNMINDNCSCNWRASPNNIAIPILLSNISNFDFELTHTVNKSIITSTLQTKETTDTIHTHNTWHIAIQNIQGLNQPDKRELYTDQIQKAGWNIVITTETNGNKANSKY